MKHYGKDLVTRRIEDLGRDKRGVISSQVSIKSGPNKGFRHPEKDGVWILGGGYTHNARVEVKCSHMCWVDTVTKLGFRVGKLSYEGVDDFYIFQRTTI
jgi:hypothetical protein